MSQSAAAIPAPSDPVAGIQDGLLGMLSVFIDPAGTARRVTLRWFWLYPYIVVTAVIILTQIVTLPYRMKATEIMLQDQGLSGEQIQTRLAMAAKFAPVGWVIAPIFLLGIIALVAWLINVASSIAGVTTRYRYLFSLASVCGMFFALQEIAGMIVLKSKSPDDITSMHDLQPPFGLDIVVHGLQKVVQGLVGFFSIFEIWAIVMYALIFAALTKSSKGKAFFATSPAWIIGMIFAMIGAMFT